MGGVAYIDKRTWAVALTLLMDLADDLEASVNGEYQGTLDYPSQKRRYDRDMQPVQRARKFLADNPV